MIAHQRPNQSMLTSNYFTKTVGCNHIVLVRQMINYHSFVCATAAVLVGMTITSSASDAPILSGDQVQKLALSTPQPTYPESARLRRAIGTGDFVLRLQRKTGKAKAVTILKSTGDKELDIAAVTSLLRWRFKPGVLPSIRSSNPKTNDAFADEDCLLMVPVEFSLTRGRPVGSYFRSSRKYR
jgi:TonB family protein